jgi:hypothetical protein
MVSDVASARMGRAVTIDEITQKDKIRVANVLAEFESRVGIVGTAIQSRFASIEKIPKITPANVAKEKEKLVHELAKMLYTITDVTGKEFEQSAKKDLKEVIQDYHTRYPSMALCGLMYHFYPAVFAR